MKTISERFRNSQKQCGLVSSDNIPRNTNNIPRNIPRNIPKNIPKIANNILPRNIHFSPLNILSQVKNVQYEDDIYLDEDNIEDIPRVCKKMPELSENTKKFPEELLPIYVISIRRQRYESLKQRLGPWSVYIQRWPSFNGNHLKNKNVALEWQKAGRLPAFCRLRRGELGCYHSHVTAWKNIVDNNLPYGVIFEDDVDLSYFTDFSVFYAAMEQIKTKNLPWDLLYLGHTKRTTNHNRVAVNLSIPVQCQCLFAYVITLNGAQTLLKYIMPYKEPVDMLTIRLGNQKIIRHLSIEPSLFQQVDEKNSDTSRIR